MSDHPTQPWVVGDTVRNEDTGWLGEIVADEGNYIYRVCWRVTGETRSVSGTLLGPVIPSGA